MNKELRAVTKSFRTTKDTIHKLNELKKNDAFQSYSESDIINQAMTDYISNISIHSGLSKNETSNMPVGDKIIKLHQLQQESNRLLEEIGDKKNIELKTARKSIDYIRSLCPLNAEVTYILFMDHQLHFIDFKKVSDGTLVEAFVNLRMIIRDALNIGAGSIILVHNHPSGVLKPSGADTIITEKTFFACECVDLKLMDSVIVGQGKKYYSFNNEGWLNFFKKRFDKTMFKKNYDMKKLSKVYDKDNGGNKNA